MRLKYLNAAQIFIYFFPENHLRIEIETFTHKRLEVFVVFWLLFANHKQDKSLSEKSRKQIAKAQIMFLELNKRIRKSSDYFSCFCFSIIIRFY